MALHVAQVSTDIIEISLRDKPAELLARSPKATVPVLITQDDQVIEQSLDIMHWALRQHDPEGWLNSDADETSRLIAQNDGPFKQALDRYKYPERYPEYPQAHYQSVGALLLQDLERCLERHASPDEISFLVKATPSLADVAVFPFVRQFAAVDPVWFDQAPLPHVQRWLQYWLASPLFTSIMQKDLVRLPAA